MKRYTFYFEIFGMKKKWATHAPDERSAAEKFHTYLLSQANIHAVDGAEIKKDAQDGFNTIFNIFGDIFNSKTWKGLFG
jgi:hypothetical protein